MCFGSNLFTFYIFYISWNIEPAYDILSAYWIINKEM